MVGGVVARLAGWLAGLDATVVGEELVALAWVWVVLSRSELLDAALAWLLTLFVATAGLDVTPSISGVSPLAGSLASSFDECSTLSLSATDGCDVVSVRLVVESLEALGVVADSLAVSISAIASGGAPLSGAGSFAIDEDCDVSDSVTALGVWSAAFEITSESEPDRPSRNPPTSARTAITATPTPIDARLEVFSLPVCTPRYRNDWRFT